jgi:hypothetical protein
MVYVGVAPQAVEVVPEGDMLPLAPAVAVMLYGPLTVTLVLELTVPHVLVAVTE